MSNSKPRNGFTLVELMLSITFIAVLLLAIAMMTIQMSSIYNKGLTLREANQAGQFVSSEVQRSLNQTYSNAVEAVNLPDSQGGRLCAGGTVYAWNYPDTFTPTERVDAINKVDGSADVRFVKFAGTIEQYCETQGGGSWKALPDTASELLSGGNANIALHSFSLDRVAVPEDNTQTIYTVKIVVGTPSVGLVTEDNSLLCKAADSKDDEWCAVNQFEFTARSGNREALQ